MKFIVPSKEGQQLLIAYLLKHNISLPKSQQVYTEPCSTSLKETIQPEVVKLNSAMFRSLQNAQFYDQHVQEGLRCTVGSILAPSSEGLSGSERFFHLFNKMKKIGEGANSIAMSAGMTQEGRPLHSSSIHLGERLSRNGHFSDLDNDGLIIAKFSKDDENDILREFLIGQILNDLRNDIPNFSQTYGILGCDAVFNDSFFCSSKGKNSVLIMEKINGISFGDWLKNASDNIDTQAELYSILFQIIQSIWFAYEKFNFIHSDLHSENILVRALHNDFYLPYFYEEGAPVFLRTHLIPTVIDYGYSRVIIRVRKEILDTLMIAYTASDIYTDQDFMDKIAYVNVAIGTRGFESYRGELGNFRSSYGPQQQSMIFDLFRILGSSYKYLWDKPKLKAVFDFVMQDFPPEFQITTTNYELWADKYFSLSPNEINILELLAFDIDEVLKKLFISFSKNFPTQLVMISNNSSMNLIDRKIPVMACSTKLIHQIEANPILSMNKNKLNIGCEANVHSILKKLNVTHYGSKSYFGSGDYNDLRSGDYNDLRSAESVKVEDLVLFYDYIMLHGTFADQLEKLKPEDRMILWNLIQLSEKQVKMFLQPTLKDDMYKLKQYIKSQHWASAQNVDIMEEWVHFLESCYKNKNIALQNITVLWNLIEKGVILEAGKEKEYMAQKDEIHNLAHQIKEVAADIVFYSQDDKIKERAKRLI